VFVCIKAKPFTERKDLARDAMRVTERTAAIEKTIDPAGRQYWVPALDRGLKLLEALGDSREPLTITELAQRTAIQIPNVYRLLWTLERLGYVSTVSGSKRYHLTRQILRIGSSSAQARRLVDIARPYLERLSERIAGTCQFTIRDRLELVFLLGFSSDMLPLRPLPVGGRLPLHATTIGAVLLSRDTDDDIRTLYRNEKFQDGARKNIDDLLRAVRKARRDGCLVGRTGTISGLMAAAAPIIDAQGRVGGAINFLCIETRKNMQQIKQRWLAELTAAAREISREAQRLDDLIL
jgi:IclR family pca regulon transcriptional regulator